jgi:hypothetical protein
LRLKRRETEEDSVRCPMKYSTDVECRSDSLAVISYRDINQFAYVNLSYGPYGIRLTAYSIRHSPSCYASLNDDTVVQQASPLLLQLADLK